nr:zinc ABC transporter substrate-binding protein [Actinopolymorpha pittospori]
MKVAGFVTPNPSTEASLADRRKLTETIHTLGVPAVFLEPNLAARSSTLTEVAREQGIFRVRDLRRHLRRRGHYLGRQRGRYFAVPQARVSAGRQHSASLARTAPGLPRPARGQLVGPGLTAAGSGEHRLALIQPARSRCSVTSTRGNPS